MEKRLELVVDEMVKFGASIHCRHSLHRPDIISKRLGDSKYSIIGCINGCFHSRVKTRVKALHKS